MALSALQYRGSQVIRIRATWPGQRGGPRSKDKKETTPAWETGKLETKQPWTSL